jgi:methylphosphotriester-DNA--protein-cysteine methyltransferase
MWVHEQLLVFDLWKLIKSRQIQLGGNLRLRIYGTLSCSSGKRMKKQNRVFFKNETEAIVLGFRPCGHCLKEKYKEWMSKNQVVMSLNPSQF